MVGSCHLFVIPLLSYMVSFTPIINIYLKGRV